MPRSAPRSGPQGRWPASCRRRWPSSTASRSASQPRRARSTTFAAAPSIAASRCGSSPSGPSSVACNESRADGQRRAPRGRRMGRGKPPLRPPRAARPPRFEDRVRAGRVRLLLRAPRGQVCLRLPCPRGPGGRPRARDGRGAGRGWRAASGSGGLRRDGRGSVRLLHARLRRRDRRPAGAQPEPERGRDPRGPVGQPLPLHGVREDLRRGQTGGRLVSATARTLELGRVGESVKRIDAIPKVTGEFAYSSDLFAAGMLWGHTLRSSHAHALVSEVDISEAVGMPGVHAVLTHSDVPGAKTYGLEFPDQPVLAIDRVRYFGEPVAIVAAEHPEQARRAAERIRVAYEPLEPVVDPEQATEREPIHEGRPTAGHGFRDDERPNVVRTIVIRHGDPDARADVAVSGVGKLGNVRARILLDGGAYAWSSAAVTANASAFACGPYAVENALVECTCVYTNNPLCGAMRGFGAVQSCFAHEAQMDKLAAELGIDPVELRLRNALAPGDTLPTGQRITGSFPAAEVIRRAAALPVPEPEELPRDALRLPGGSGNTTRGEGVRRGVGFAVGFKNVCYSEGFDDSTAARVRLTASDEGLAAEVHCAAAEVGQGVVNVILQTARTELDLDDVVLGAATTSSVGSAGSASASRMTWMAAGAVQLAARAAHEELARRGGNLAPGETIDVERIYHHRPTTPLDPETGQVTGDGAHVAYICAAMRVVAEVDVELGLTRVVWIGTAQDVGKAVNPQAAYGQSEGGIAQGLGLALMEEIQTRDGLITNASFTDYLVPTTLDMPPVDAELVEEPEPDAPYGVKGVGEPPTVVSTAAVVSALRDATGRELARVPVRPDEIVGLS